VEACCGDFRDLAKDRIESDIETPAGSAVEERAGGYCRSEHLFEAECLRAELYLVRPMGFGFPTFVLDWKRPPSSGAPGKLGIGCVLRPMELDDVCLSDETKSETAQSYATCDMNVFSRLRTAAVGGLVEIVALDGERVVEPKPLKMDEGGLALTEDEML
jgi:hypothetical protein